jgi:gluconokinase
MFLGGDILLLKIERENKKLPILAVVMGVSGCGKTTLAQEIANHYQITFLDADAFHSEKAMKQMSEGIPLTDEQRAPWIDRICRELNQLASKNISCVLAYSGLKKQHRQLIFASYHCSLGILLNTDQALISQRMADRGGHFMSPQLLSSQIAAMEPINENRAESLPEHALEKIELVRLSAAEPVESLLLKSIDFINHAVN